MKNGDGYVGHAGVVLVAEHGAPEETAPLEVDDEVMLREEIRPEDWSCHVRYQEALLDHRATRELDRHTSLAISVDRRTVRRLQGHWAWRREFVGLGGRDD